MEQLPYPPLLVERLTVRRVRNLDGVDLEPARRLNVLTGHNGHGKTSLLEGLYLACTTKSFRTAKLRELVQHRADTAFVGVHLLEEHDHGPVRRKQTVGVEKGKRTARIDGEPPPSLTAYALLSPVVVFDPAQLRLSTGPASERRTLLDRVSLYAVPAVGEHRTRYRRALRERQHLLAETRDLSNPALGPYERLLAEHGAAITRVRREVSERLALAMRGAFTAIAAPNLSFDVAYAPGGHEDPQEAERRLYAARQADLQRRSTGFGPHRDDLRLTIDGRLARVVASQGQHRAITLSLKVAEMSAIAHARQRLPILLLDDVSSELDAERTAALFRFLAQTRSQTFLTTTRANLILEADIAASTEAAERRFYDVLDGEISLRMSGG
ncbi:MAG: DNA replication and repair protein RecF [Myxococcota bacterium]